MRAGNPEIDTLLMGTSCTAVGSFRCPIDHPAFIDSGPISDPLVAFPRTAVWIQHDGARPFHSDPNVVTIYNRGQVYRRRASARDGDRSDWFALSDDVAREVATAVDASASDAERPFGRSRAASSAGLYLKQRTLYQQVLRGEVSALELDERVFDIAFDVLSGGTSASPRRVRPTIARRRDDIVEAARAVLAGDAESNISVRDVARAVGTSPFHLCRLFRSRTGMTLRAYRNEVRCRLALEDLAVAKSTISEIAHRLGFASHAHLVRLTHEMFGGSPTAIRKHLRAV
jgi:AraC-like DNA-binding protein